MAAFGFKTTALEVVKGLNLKGYEVLVTGGASGIGVETVRALASVGARVHLTARDISKSQPVADELNNALGSTNVDAGAVDISSLKSIDTFCKHFLAKKRPINILINNAGVMATPLAYTEDGFEMQIGTNHFGHFALFKGLMPALLDGHVKLGKKSRVVSVGSLAHARCGIDFKDMHYKQREYNKWMSYSQSKTANHLFSVELSRRYAAQGIVSNSLHPGVIKTNLARHRTPEEEAAMKDDPMQFRWKSIEQGASTSVWAACAPELEALGGLYLNDSQIGKESTPEEIMEAQAGYMSYAVDPEDAKILWELTEKQIQEARQK